MVDIPQGKTVAIALYDDEDKMIKKGQRVYIDGYIYLNHVAQGFAVCVVIEDGTIGAIKPWYLKVEQQNELEF